jgi:hypothetical protein
MSASNGHRKAEIEKPIVVFVDTTPIANALERGLNELTERICDEYRVMVKIIEKFTKQGKEDWQ